MITNIRPGFDDKILSVYMRGWSMTTGTAHPYVWLMCVEPFDDRYSASSVWVCVRKSATGAAQCNIYINICMYCILLAYFIGARRVVT